MSVPSSVEELVQLIRKSGMVDDHKLTAYLQRREFTRGLPDDAREFADDMVRDAVLTNFQAEQFLLGKWRGFTIGKFKLLERVGVGGMGQVFLCEHMFMRKRLAVKVLPPAKAEQPAALGRFYREARAAGGLDHPKIVLGTADYVAPEQVANSHAVDIRADVYALGATFYFLLAGHPPFPTGTVSQKLLWHRTKEPTPIRQVRPEVPEGLAAIITRMMAKDPKVRFQTPAQVEA